MPYKDAALSFRWLGFLLSALLPVLAGCSATPLQLDVFASRRHGDLKPVDAVADHQAVSVNEPISADQEKPAAAGEMSAPSAPAPSAPAPMPMVEPRAAALSLTDLEGIAVQNNPTLAAAVARIQSAQGRRVQAGLYPNPVVGYHATEVGNRGTSGGQGGFVSQRFITAGKLQLDEAIAGKELDEAHFRWEAQELRVLNDVRIRYFEALIAQQRVELTAELVQIGDNLVDATETLLEDKQATENDLLQAEIRAENAHILHDNATNEHVEAWRRLVAVLGVPQMELTPLHGEPDSQLPDFAWEECYEAILASHPEVNAARMRVERERLAIARAKREPIPNVDAFVSIRHNELTDSDVANVQVGIPIPIFDKNQGNLRRAEADWVAASREVDHVALALQDRFAVTFRRYRNAFQQAKRYGETIVPKAKRSLALVTQGYEKGQVEYLTLLTAQQTYVEVSLSHLDSLRELQIASAILEGKLLTGSLDSPRSIR